MYFSKNISRCFVQSARVRVKSGDALIGCGAMTTRDYCSVGCRGKAPKLQDGLQDRYEQMIQIKQYNENIEKYLCQLCSLVTFRYCK